MGLAVTESSALSAQVTVNIRDTYQRIDGFGFSAAFGHAAEIANASEPLRSQVLDLLFSTTKGAGLTILRNIIYSDSLSIEPVSPGSPDVMPKYVWDGSDSGQVYLAKAAQRYGVETIYADSWSAPPFMKTNNNTNNGGYLCGVTGATCESGDWRQAFANYLSQYIKFYAQSGVQISHIGFLNEPDHSFSYASMQSNGTQAASFIKVLSPTLKKAGLGRIKITCCDAEGWESARTYIPELEAAGVMPDLDVVTSHGYTSPPGAAFNTTKPVWMTEWADLSHKWTGHTGWATTGGASDGIYWARQIQHGLVTSGVSGWINWQGASKGNSSDELIFFTNTTVETSGRLWAFAHFGRFVRPGSVRVAATSTNASVTVSAFTKGDFLVVQVINSATTNTTLEIGGFGTFVGVTPVLTNEVNQLQYGNKIKVQNGKFGYTIPALSMVSFIQA